MVSCHVMAIYLKWHMCPSHEPRVTQILFVQILVFSETNKLRLTGDSIKWNLLLVDLLFIIVVVVV